MKLSDVLTPSFRALGRQLGLKVELFEGRLVAIAPLWRRAFSTESLFCRALVACGYLTERQMKRAAWRYRLGITRQGGVIFWQIDQEDVICDGKVMYYRPDCHRDKERHPTWVSTLLCRRRQWADADRLSTRHCFFGLHLLGHTEIDINVTQKARNRWSSESSGESSLSDIAESRQRKTTVKPQKYLGHTDDTDSTDYKKTVCVVESEKSAVILSEWFPQYVWMATGGMGNVQPERFRGLRGQRVILFPDTDTDGTAYRRWYEAAQVVMRQPFWEESPPIRVSPVLEQHATPEQKEAKIDLVDFLFDPP